jgi:hypothetical protein
VVFEMMRKRIGTVPLAPEGEQGVIRETLKKGIIGATRRRN